MLSYSDGMDMTALERARRKKEIRREFFYAIYQVLLLHRGPIHEFTLEIDEDDTYFEIDQIILHLSRNHTIKKLKIKSSSSYGLSLYVFSLHHLTDLSLKYCTINHKPIFNGFDSLTSLSLDEVTMSKETLLHLLSSCPSLKNLDLLLCYFIVHGVASPTITELFKCLSMIEHLTISGHFILSLVQASVLKELPTSLIHLKYCAIEDMCFVDGSGLPFLCVLIKCSPNLEKIKLEINGDCCLDRKCDEEHSDELENYTINLEEYSDIWSEHLNEVEIIGFSNLMNELEFVKFILARSPSLKKVTLQTCMDDKSEDMLKILLRTPRASPVEIVVEDWETSL